MAGKGVLPFLVVGMLVTGISNSIFNKYQDMQCVARCDDADPARHIEFSQPVWQTATMFLGECLCLVPVICMAIYRSVSRHGLHDAVSKVLLRKYRQEQTAAGGAVGSAEEEALLPESRGRRGNGHVAAVSSAPEQEGESLEGAKVWLFFGPAACDICGTTLVSVQWGSRSLQDTD